MIIERESDSTLNGIKVAKESRAKFESDFDQLQSLHAAQPLPVSPDLKSSYASHPTTPPAIRLQHHFSTPHKT